MVSSIRDSISSRALTVWGWVLWGLYGLRLPWIPLRRTKPPRFSFSATRSETAISTPPAVDREREEGKRPRWRAGVLSGLEAQVVAGNQRSLYRREAPSPPCLEPLSTQGDVFFEFMNNNGSFKEELSKDLKGLQSLYEASHMAVEGEELLSQAMEFSKQHLKASMQYLDPNLAQQVGMTLAFPRQRMMERFEARRFIEHFSQDFRKNSPIIELATLDFNSVQSLYQKEIIELKRWWRELGLTKKLPFGRDRPLECFLWTVGLFPEPNFSECRIEVAKAVAILLVLDDVYDSYGSLDELILFTDAVQRWDIQAIEHLPEYMKICYMALYNSINVTGYKILKEHGWFIIPQLTKQWQKICEAFLVEARWFNNEHVPTLEDYLNNGITTAGTYMALVYAFYLIGKQVTKESADLVNACPKLFHNSGRILRLWDDLGTAKVLLLNYLIVSH
ncbi:hypothetical protein J5N97_002796 [Dioscorea zingiberensis]|uniref:Uncharacterized protein n=1 Tax=Dioscorea zingiberensis TaxID=325984 RepID=A0A9D5D2U9_9LILI|nr:hypothetical protein J5N97_002796 [Dioscorea zingiberensis]